MIRPVADEHLEIATLADRPDLLPVVARWLWQEWWNKRGVSLEDTQARYAASCEGIGIPATLVLLADDRPIGTATLARQDLESRPDLTPWLAGVFVIPERRGKGYVHRLLAAFDEACRAASIERAWLYTSRAERVYLRAGWQRVEVIQGPAKLPATLMCRDYAG